MPYYTWATLQNRQKHAAAMARVYSWLNNPANITTQAIGGLVLVACAVGVTVLNMGGF